VNYPDFLVETLPHNRFPGPLILGAVIAVPGCTASLTHSHLERYSQLTRSPKFLVENPSEEVWNPGNEGFHIRECGQEKERER